MNSCSALNLHRETIPCRTTVIHLSEIGQESVFVRYAWEIMRVQIKGAEDRRIQKTQHLLRGALVSLISEKPYDAIVVKEILDRANVGRSTFYTHFRDKDDLLVSGIHEMLRPVQSTAQPAAGKRRDRILWFSLPIFEYHYQHRHAGGDRIGPRGRAILHDHLRRVLAGVIAEVMKKDF